MGKCNVRYAFLKNSFKNSVVFLEKNNKLKTYDKEFLKFIKYKNLKSLDKLKIDYIVVNNMTIIEHKKFDKNKYQLYYARFRLYKLIKSIISDNNN